MRKLLQLILKFLSKAAIKKYKPLIIGITGSVGKTSTKEAVWTVLRSKYKVRKSVGSFNTEDGLPISILGDWSEEELKLISKFGPAGKKINKSLLWLKILFSGFFNVLFLPKSKYPEILVLEYGADRPNDIEKLIKIARPKIGVVTAVGELPVHLEFYSGPEEVAQEKSKLIKALPPDGLAVLNHDDEIVFEMKGQSLAEVITYGFSEDAGIQASDVSYFLETLERIAGGISFKVNYEKGFVPFRLMDALGRHQIYAALAATAVGLHLGVNPVRGKTPLASAGHAQKAGRTSNGMNLVEISQALAELEFPNQRMKLLRGIRNSWIIDDSYNASPLSTHAALDTLREFGDKVIAKTGIGRKVAILGDMKELGVFTEKAHRLIGNLAGERTEYLFTVGPAAKFIADSAFNQLPKENIFSFNDADEAKETIYDFIQEGDVVLVKGSRAMKMEKVIEVLARV